MFFALRQLGDHSAVYLVVRGPEVLIRIDAIRSAVRAVDASLPLDRVVPLQDVVDASVAPRRFLAGLLTAFSGLALLLATLGIYGVIAYGVVQRRREIGIRVAVGASSLDIQTRVVREAMTLVGAGLAIGVAGALAGGRLLAGMLFGVTAWDPVSYLAVIVALGAAGLLAGYLPARRAARINPLECLVPPR
jgi:ABC-type antimicrobial peptide transport system permease subunit